MHGRPACCEPVWKNVMAGSWLIASVCIDLTMHSSSTILAVCGSSSLTHVPDLPCWANLNSEPASGNDSLDGGHAGQPLAHADDVGQFARRSSSAARLVIEQVELRRPAALKEVDDALRARHEMRGLQQRSRRIARCRTGPA